MRTFFPCLCIFIFFSLHIRAQQLFLLEKDGEKSVMLQSGVNQISVVPLSFPETAMTGSNTYSLSDVRDFDWELKFSATGKVFKDVSFATPLVGYIVTELGAVYKSDDGGESWNSVLNLGFPYYWYGVHALTPDTVVIAGFNNQALFNEGVIRWTFDGGSTWSSDINLSIPITGVGWLERIHFFNADTGIVFNSFSGGVWYTMNGGKDSTAWTYISINSDFGWIAGNVDAQSSGNVYATGIHFANSTDFGATWMSAASADSVFDGGIDFLDSDNSYGWTGGGQISAPVAGWVRRTTDGGASWSSRLSTFSYPIRALKFFDDTTGIVVGGNVYDEAGGIYSTTDGGTNWNLDVSTDAEMFSVETKMISNDSMILWCVGSTGPNTGFTGVVYKATTGKLATAIQNISTNPAASKLYQNNPNPFSTSTEIGFMIPVLSQVSLKVYDVLGSEVRTLLDNVEMNGYGSVQFDAGELKSGVYFYQLQAGSYSVTKKLILQ